MHGTREKDAKQWEHAEPVRLSAKNLDMNAFNKLFEESHIPDPDTDGYGDWLKNTDGGSSGPKFSEKFNRDVFNRMFDDETRKLKQPSNQLVHPGEMALTRILRPPKRCARFLTSPVHARRMTLVLG